MNAQLWASTAVIAGGYLIGFYFQNRRLDDLRSEIGARFSAIDRRFDDLKDWIRAELRRLDERLDRLEHPVARPQQTFVV